MELTEPNMLRCIADYARTNRGGLDVTAFVLLQLGRDSIQRYADHAHITFNAAKQHVGREVKRLLQREGRWVRQHRRAKVDPTRWPGLAGWVSSYTEHETTP